jgi:hypothetical protein
LHREGNYPLFTDKFFVLALSSPAFDRFAVIDPQVVQNQKYLSFGSSRFTGEGGLDGWIQG